MPIEHVLECGDCLELMKALPDKSVDMVLTSPPYDDLRNYKGFHFDFEGVAQQFAGSGTTGVASVETGRNSIQFELSPEYFDIATRRLDEALAKRQEKAATA